MFRMSRAHLLLSKGWIGGDRASCSLEGRCAGCRDKQSAMTVSVMTISVMTVPDVLCPPAAEYARCAGIRRRCCGYRIACRRSRSGGLSVSVLSPAVGMPTY